MVHSDRLFIGCNETSYRNVTGERNFSATMDDGPWSIAFTAGIITNLKVHTIDHGPSTMDCLLTHIRSGNFTPLGFTPL
jgi:hypothetical protein